MKKFFFKSFLNNICAPRHTSFLPSQKMQKIYTIIYAVRYA